MGRPLGRLMAEADNEGKRVVRYREARWIGRCVAFGLLVGFTSTLAGCYTYQPAAPSRITPRQNVRVTVTTAQQAELAEVLHSRSQSFPATYLSAEDGEFLFSVPLRSPAPGMRVTTLRNRISIPASDVIQIEARKLSVWRTAATVAAIAAGIGVAATTAFGGDTKDDAEKRGGVDQSRVPLLRWSLPIGR